MRVEGKNNGTSKREEGRRRELSGKRERENGAGKGESRVEKLRSVDLATLIQGKIHLECGVIP